MRRTDTQIFDITIASVGEVRRLFAINLPHVPVRVTSRPQCFDMDGRDTPVRRGSVLVYNRERQFWVLYRTIYDALAGCRHALRGYGVAGMFPRTELVRLDGMILNTDAARDIMLRYREMTTDVQRSAAAVRLADAANEYRMPRVEKKIRARHWLVRAARFMAPPRDQVTRPRRGPNPGAALATSLPARDRLRARQEDIRESIAPRLRARDQAILRELNYCLAVFGRLAQLLDDLRVSPIFALTDPDEIHAAAKGETIPHAYKEWHRVMYALADISFKLDALVLPSPFSRYQKRIALELRRAAVELEARNFKVAASLVDRAVSSLDFLAFAQRLFEFKEELAFMQLTPLAVNGDRVMEMCVTLHGMACLLNGDGFARDTSENLRVIMQQAVVRAGATPSATVAVRDLWDSAERLLG